jgi:hypothetical protein
MSLRPVLRAITAIAICAVLWPGAASAWSARGHMMVGDIATKLLTPSAAAAVRDLLRDDLGADGKPSGRTTLGQVSSWPDELRLNPEQRATGAYHFDDVPICGVPDKTKYCKDGQCGTVWFARQVAVLKDRSQTPRARNEALKWIVHLSGDLHQPLHASDNADRGGNDIQITFLGKRSDDPVNGSTPTPYNFHTAWDRLIPYKLFDDVGGYDRFLADMPSEATRADWEVGNMDEWAAESFVLSRDFLYPSLPAEFVCDRPLKGIIPIDAYNDRMSEVVAAAQLRKAGVRLAKVLNDILSAR